MEILFNADDFGLTKGVTDGIIKAHTNGVVTSTTLMMNGYAVDYAVSEAKKHPELNVGIHLVLTFGSPISNNVSNLINENGTFKFTNPFIDLETPDIKEVKREWVAQIEAFLATGLTLHHIDSHHHIHGWPPLRETVIQLANEYQVPVRYVDSLKDEEDILLTELLWEDFYGEGVDEAIFEKIKSKDVSSIEVMTHPAIVDDTLRGLSSYTDKREEELKILCSLEIPEWANLIKN